jgi:phosphoglycerate dehydrogenase-like enzyme
MNPRARFINVGRGALVDEDALVVALREGQIAGAALDVFVEEPLPSQSPFWTVPNCVVSPHMSGDYAEHEAAMAQQFLVNWQRFCVGDGLSNLIDKQLGFAAKV